MVFIALFETATLMNGSGPTGILILVCSMVRKEFFLNDANLEFALLGGIIYAYSI